MALDYLLIANKGMNNLRDHETTFLLLGARQQNPSKGITFFKLFKI